MVDQSWYLVESFGLHLPYYLARIKSHATVSKEDKVYAVYKLSFVILCCIA